MEPGSKANRRYRRFPVRQLATAAVPAVLALLAGCGPELSTVTILQEPVDVPVVDAGPRVLRIDAPPDAPVLVTVSARDVDIRAAVTHDGAEAAAICDAPNRRMGVETLLIEAPHAPVVTVRIERNDHSGARGVATVEAVALPLVTAGDRLRLAAARHETTACLAFPVIERGREAADAYALAAKAWSEAGDGQRSGLALLHESGARYVRQSDWRLSSDLAARAFARLDTGNSPAHAAYALRLEGAALNELANASNYELELRAATLERAQARLLEAESRFRQLAMPYEAGYAASYRGVSRDEAGDKVAARADFRTALAHFRAAGDPPAQALVLQSLAYQSHEDGRAADAAREFEQALAMIPRDADPANYAHTLHNSALPLRVLGRFDEAIARYHEAADILNRLGDRDGEARSLHSLGILMMNIGETERARELLRTAVGLRTETGARREQAIGLINLADLERAAGRHREALDLDLRALDLSVSPPELSRVLPALVRDHLAAGDHAAARSRLDALLKLGLPATHRALGVAYTELADLELQAGNADAAWTHFARAIAIHRANGSELDHARTLERRARARLLTGDAAGASDDSAAALTQFESVGVQALQADARAAFRASYRQAVALHIEALLAQSQSSARSGDAEQTQRLWHAAFLTSDRTRAQRLAESAAATAAKVPAGLLAERQQTYEQLAVRRQQRDRLLESAAPDTERLQALTRDIELLRARARLNDGRIARLQSGGSTASRHGDELAQLVPQGVVVAEFFVAADRSWLFEVRDGRLRVHELPPGPELERRARELHLSWRNHAAAGGNRLAPASRLARTLFGAMGDDPPAAGIWIVPDGALHLIPLAQLAGQAWPALPAGAAQVITSLSTLRDAPGPDAKPPRTLALVADPVYEPDDPRISGPGQRPASSAAAAHPWRRLPSTAIEARELMALVADPAETLVLLGPQASRQRVMGAALDQYRIVHFAAHALADSRDPALATIVLSQYGADGQAVDGALRQYDIARLRLNADLVVLSGCDTAIGREIAGEGPIGLSHAVLGSGARAVVATLWQVPDSSTAVLMREFYREMLQLGRAAPEALARAQQHLRQQTRWADPYFWAGFQLVSNARPGAGNNGVTGREE
ncbi:MAG: CHAT domain-containing protein [Steroidobacteraceae bacterium]|nr:CHAT domain-containing protein [Steroidobacteraceae bacterium]